jgi:hypothetical protein
MDTKATEDVVNHIDRAIGLNRWIYIPSAILIALVCLISIYNLIAIQNSAVVTLQAYDIAQKNEARINANEEQILNYMRVTTQYWDKLFKDNRGKIKVPRVTVPAPGELAEGPKTDAELTRQISPTPTPEPAQTHASKRKPRTKPPSTFWEKVFGIKPSK